MGRYCGYAVVEADELFSSYLATTLYALANLSDGSYTLDLKEDFSLSRAVPFSLLPSCSGGRPDKEFTYLFGDGALGLSIQTVFSFCNWKRRRTAVGVATGRRRRIPTCSCRDRARRGRAASTAATLRPDRGPVGGALSLAYRSA